MLQNELNKSIDITRKPTEMLMPAGKKNILVLPKIELSEFG